MFDNIVMCDVSDGLLLSEERLEDVPRLRWYISCWCLWSDKAECYQGENCILWQVW